MNNGSSRVNRHGIPIRENPPKPCIWDRCTLRAAPELDRIPLCYPHATHVHDAVKADIERLQEVLRQRREDGIAEQMALRGLMPFTPPPPKPEIVYYLQVGGHIKIGWTKDLEKRMRAYPPNTVLLAMHPGSRADERQLHRRFAVHRSHGKEWYPLVPVVLDHIKRVIAEHGEPPAITFGARPVEVRMPRQKATLQAKYGPMLRG